MDGQRFDDLTRALAKGTSRRRVVKALAGVLGGALTGGIGSKAVAAKPGGGNGRPCTPVGNACGEKPCCDGLSCIGGVCCSSSQICGTVCCPVGTVCTDGACVATGNGGGGGNGGGSGGSAGCPEGSVRFGSACLLVNGQVCADGTQCASGICVDGYCCDGACGGQCEACDVAGAEGTCTVVSGAPHGNRTSCAGSRGCAGSCDGMNRSGCTYPGLETTCGGGGPICTEAYVSQANCNGAGDCIDTSYTCAPYACDNIGTGCLTSCLSHAGCIDTHYCSEGVCVPGDRSFGESCTSGRQCASGHCVDGVCCTSACEDQCFSCILSTSRGICAPFVNHACSTGNPCTVGETCQSDGTCGGGGQRACPTCQTCSPETGQCVVDDGQQGTRCPGTNNGVCSDGACVCKDLYESCTEAFQCCPNEYYASGATITVPTFCEIVPPNKSPVQRLACCSSLLGACESSVDCCGELSCDTTNGSTAPRCCIPTGSSTTCSSNIQCCGGFCINGRCSS